jgi:hypothetical protein
MDIREAEIAARIRVGKAFMLDATQMQDRRVDVVSVDRPLHGQVTVVVESPVAIAGPKLPAVVCNVSRCRETKFPWPSHDIENIWCHHDSPSVFALVKTPVSRSVKPCAFHRSNVPGVSRSNAS